ncbi:4'-phosphopantetheinyl transferase family protein [Roseibium sp. Sym1]|uniref:4'-phosphopantetheinyl transferase family protein n=1 Tax=Roseibium sp. Sym1 TaxID=3016006 RepID=UPI0022B56467|nr:4'-phosphopantetheinyl transferase superfamily protein [Roseibium sp. Sym1]
MQYVKVTILQTDRCGSGDVDAALTVLSAEELDRYRKFHFAEDRRDYALAHALLRRTLNLLEPATDAQSWQFDADGTGKPRISGRPNLDFSLTHARGLVACAVTNAGQVGIDAETEQRAVDVDLLAGEVCSPSEQRALAGMAARGRTARFLDFWTLKEAFLKATGIGVATDLAAVGFGIGTDDRITADFPPNLRQPSFSFRLCRTGTGGRIALAVSGDLQAQDAEMTRVARWDE